MTQRELKNKLYDLISAYFSGATVVWGKTDAVRPQGPFVTLTTGSIVRHYHPISQTVNGVLVNCYPTQTTLQVDLFTTGLVENTAVNDLTEFLNFLSSEYADDWCEANDVTILANTVQDLTQLINDTAWDYRAMVELEIWFTQSAVGYAGIMYEAGVPYYETGTPQVNDDGIPCYPDGQPKYDAEGYHLSEEGQRLPELPLPKDESGTPIYPDPIIEPSPSGGGSQELAQQSTGWFEQVELSEEEDTSNA